MGGVLKSGTSEKDTVPARLYNPEAIVQDDLGELHMVDITEYDGARGLVNSMLVSYSEPDETYRDVELSMCTPQKEPNMQNLTPEHLAAVLLQAKRETALHTRNVGIYGNSSEHTPDGWLQVRD